LWTDWHEIFWVSLYWANLEMIKLWTPYSLWAKFTVDELAVGDIATKSQNLVQ